MKKHKLKIVPHPEPFLCVSFHQFGFRTDVTVCTNCPWGTPHRTFKNTAWEGKNV